MKTYVESLVNVLKTLFKSIIFWTSLVILIFGISLNQLSAMYLQNKYGNSLPILHDLILDSLPMISIAWVYDLSIILAMVTFFVFVLHKDYKKIPYFLFIFGLMNIIRGIFIILTPFGCPNGYELGLFSLTAFKAGLYPSGHTGTAFLAFLLSYGKYKKIIFGFVLLIVVTLLLGHGHYSIDIFSAILFAYALYSYSEKYCLRSFTLKINRGGL